MIWKRLLRTAALSAASLLVLSLQMFTVNPLEIFISNVLVNAILFVIVLTGALSESIVCAVVIAFFTKYFGIIDGYVLPDTIITYVLTVFFTYRLRATRFYWVTVIATLTFFISRLIGRTVAFAAVKIGEISPVALTTAFRDTLDNCAKDYRMPLFGILLAMAIIWLYKKWREQ